ncbi:MAG: hypothetical protein COA82_06140 [Alkaliphilus sp.]|nr:hypothetical protein [bacterium AH-315-K05]MBN4074463.1 hypothetical protein [bacterium AH-315-E09]PHS34965.1 MAG: hypothetical protein COA82_06140 [Alkaliphilus sp.]
MKIDPINPLKPAPRVLRYMDNKKKKQGDEKAPKDSYIVSEKTPSEKTMYTRDQVSIKRLMKESERTYQQLIDIVENLLKRQGYYVEKLGGVDLEQLEHTEIDEIAVKEAQELIGIDGELGAEKTSERIFKFAVAISGGDKSKLEDLKNAIKQGFEAVGEIIGELPEVSKETYRLVMEKLDAWSAE